MANKVLGLVAGTKKTKNPRSYLNIGIDRHLYKTHRIIFLWHHGWLPIQVDHKDTNKLNNKITNLRACTNEQNIKNQPVYKNNELGIKGVRKSQKEGEFIARIRVDKKLIYLGIHPSKEAAALAYNQAALKYFGEFARINEIP